MFEPKRNWLLLSICFLWFTQAKAFSGNFPDSVGSGKLTVSGLVDVYWGSDLGQTNNLERPYASSSARLHEIIINMAYIGLSYEEERVRAKFVPGFGTYINSNNAQEPGSLKNILEANAGFKLFNKKDIWLEAGIFGAPYTNESAISKDNWLYTRSMAAENSPYYLSGLRLSYPITDKLTARIFLMNGWQQMVDLNKPHSLGTQLEYKPNKKSTLSWSTYLGSEQTNQTPLYRNRYFNDAYFIYEASKKLSLSTDVYFGLQEVKDTLNNKENPHTWWQANLQAKFQFTPKVSLSGRIEYMQDKDEVVIPAATSSPHFSATSGSLCFNYHLTQNAVFRLEGRTYISDSNLFPSEKKGEVKGYSFVMGSLCIGF
ncbi:MAG: porin [Bacteroidia bacterium]|nr:porin [Bacteroidia bacterium]MCF8427331.1 porin [Bacteroidia bacterium]MCF8448119.1 porin [Bacteroidia bacterium]